MALRNLFRRAAPTALDPSFGLSLGDLDGPVGRIAPSGTIATSDGSWRIEWGVKAGPDWRIAARERAVRQTRVDDTPVFETRMRVPRGDVVQRVGVVNDGRSRAVVIEYENASPDAVVVATAGFADATMRSDAEGIVLDGTRWIVPARSGAAVVAEDVWAAIEADPTGVDATGRGAGAVLTPLPHRQSVAVVVVVEGTPPARTTSPIDIAAGWRAVMGAALEVDVPDADLVAAWRRIQCDLVLAAGADDPLAAAEAAWWLDLAGLSAEADRGRSVALRAVDRGRFDADLAVATLRALASKDLRRAAPSGLGEVAGPLVARCRDRLDRATVDVVVRALEREAPDAAGDARRLFETVTVDAWSPSTAAAAGAARVLGHLFDDADPSGVLSLLPTVPENWRGHSVDVRGMVTGSGRLSFSVRWHGARPALLWQREGGADGVELRCPGLDPTWSSTQRSGDALLEVG